MGFKILEQRMKIHDERYDKGEGIHFWFQVLLYTLIGQFCWNVENQWFALFLNAHITLDVFFVSAMTILSATLTCISSLVFGTLSDRTGKRSLFLGIGFISWGVTTILMYICQPIAEYGHANGIQSIVLLAAWMVVLIDGIMSFCGSIGYDAAVNVWINDHTTIKNKGIVGAIVGIMPVVATIGGTVIGGAIIGENQNYLLLFLIMGILVILAGIFALIFTRDKADLKPNKDGTFMHQLLTPFRFKELKGMPNMKELIFALLIICVYYISFNTYFPYLGTWAVYRLGFSEFGMGVVEAIGMVLGVVVAIFLSKLIKNDKLPINVLVGITSTLIGLIMMYLFVRTPEDVDSENLLSTKNILIIISIFFVGTGEVLMTTSLMVWTRGLFPPKNRGTFEGVRSIFFVWVPMLIGTVIGGIVIKAFSDGFLDTANNPIDVPQQNLFLIAAIVTVLSYIPFIPGWILYFKRVKAKKEAEAKGIIDPSLYDSIAVDTEGNQYDLATESGEKLVENEEYSSKE